MEAPPRYVATLTSKGQLTLPADLRRDLGLRQGDRVEFAREDTGAYTVRRVVEATALDRAVDRWRDRWQPAGQSGAGFIDEVRGPLEDRQPRRKPPGR